MYCAELYEKLSQKNNEAYIEIAGQQHEDDEYFEYEAFINKAEEKIKELIPEIEEETKDWSSEEWEKLFYTHVDAGDTEILAYISDKIRKACGDDFFALRIKENISVIKDDVYSNSEDKKKLRDSDILFTAVKSLNRMKAGGADSYIIEAFETCAMVNEHITNVLAEYIARECPYKITQYFENGGLEFEKLSILLDHYISAGGRDDKLYGAVKKYFKALPNDSEDKIMLALILGDYGNPNSIPMLRSFAKKLIDKYVENNDKELFSQIMMVFSAIEKMGGLTDDLLN